LYTGAMSCRARIPEVDFVRHVMNVSVHDFGIGEDSFGCVKELARSWLASNAV
jgi:hypothetical protein